MNLRDYWQSLKPESARQAFAEQCGSTLGYFKLLASGHAKCGPDLAIRIEAASDGMVRVESLRPDVPWHVVRGKPDALPDPASQSEAA